MSDQFQLFNPIKFFPGNAVWIMDKPFRVRKRENFAAEVQSLFSGMQGHIA